MRCVCEKEARKFDNLADQTPCTCHCMSHVPGNTVHSDGHIALIPSHIPYPNGLLGRPNDPLPLPGPRVR